MMLVSQTSGPRIAGQSIGEALVEGAARLAAAGIDAPGREARLLLAHAAGAASETIFAYPERHLAADAAAYFQVLLRRRARRQPLAQVLGRREFWSLDFKVTPSVLTPRPESETLIEALLAARPKADAWVLDLGCGSGCLLLALLWELPGARGLGVDVAADAIAVAEDNAHALGLDARARFAVGDWGAPVAGHFDVIVSNPPYVACADFASLAPEVCRHEPRVALDGGADGLESTRAMSTHVARLLAPGGVAAVEIGAGQGIEVEDIFASCGLSLAARRRDLAGIERCLLFGRRALP